MLLLISAEVCYQWMKQSLQKGIIGIIQSLQYWDGNRISHLDDIFYEGV